MAIYFQDSGVDPHDHSIRGVNLVVSSARNVRIVSNDFRNAGLSAPPNTGAAYGVDQKAVIWISDCEDVKLDGNNALANCRRGKNRSRSNAMKLTTLLFAAALGAAVTSRAVPQVDQTPHNFDHKLDYWLYLPDDYNKSTFQQWPLMLFLHGGGSCGTNLAAVLKLGPPKLVNEGKQFPLIIVSPQCPPKQGGWKPDTLMHLLNEVESKYRVDKDRVYLTGLSMGGFGTWRLAGTEPEHFAAIAPICGGGDPAMASRLRRLPIWVFHGAKDKAVPVQRSVDMVDALKRAGADVKLTIYPDAEHDSWTRTYADPAFWEWLLRQRRH
jgi:predicted esterase